MFNLVKNYKKLFLMCVRNNFEADAGKEQQDFSQKIQELQSLDFDKNNLIDGTELSAVTKKIRGNKKIS